LKKTYTFSAGRASNDTSSLIDWTPLVGVDGTVKKWPVRFSYRHNQSKDQRQSAGKTVTTKNSDNLDLNYDIDQSSKFTEIKLLTWTVPVSGKTSTGVKFSREGSKTVTKDQESNNESSFALTPHLSYVFTNNVTGTLEYTFSSKEINGMNTTSNLGALTVDIQF